MGVIFVSFDNVTPVTCIYSFAYDRFNWCDGIRYSYITFCAKSASILLVDFSLDIVASKIFSVKVELKFICAAFHIFYPCEYMHLKISDSR